MGGRRFLALLILYASIASLSPSAHAQCRLCDMPTTGRDESGNGQDIRLEIETSLNFDRLILYGEGSGTAVIRPDGTTSAQGTVSDISPRAMVGSAVERDIVGLETPQGIAQVGPCRIEDSRMEKSRGAGRWR